MFLEILIAACIIAICFGSLALGRFTGARAKRRLAARDSGGVEHMNVLQGALLGLLGLLLGFSFSGASSRYLARQDLVVREANAMSTAWLRSQLLDEPHKQRVQSALQQYAAQRSAHARTTQSKDWDAVDAKLEGLQQAIWSGAIEGISAKPSITMALLPPLNDLFDLHSERKSSARVHLPALVLSLLVLAALLTLGTVGFASALSEQTPPIFAIALTLLIASALWATIDLDHPRRGLVTVDSTAIFEAERSMR